jgi:hypothetical protein
MCNCIQMLATKGLAHWELVTHVSANLSLLPEKPGVYVLRASGRGKHYGPKFQRRYLAEVTQLHEYKVSLFHKFGLTWTPDSDRTFIERRLERLSRIEHSNDGSCSLLYIGGSKNLRQRLEQLLCKEDRHTIEHPVRALLLNGWQIECAWKPTPNYREEENQLKTAFQMDHSGAMPPLVDR